MPAAVEAWSPSHWTARELPSSISPASLAGREQTKLGKLGQKNDREPLATAFLFVVSGFFVVLLFNFFFLGKKKRTQPGAFI